jgi:hypothetical protein
VSERTARRDLVFVDESGDPGADLDSGSSGYFAIGCLHLTDISIERLHRHYCAFGYFQTRLRELKSSRLSRLQKDQLADIVKSFAEDVEMSASVVYLNKRKYTGPYLRKGGSRPQNPVFFRNFVTRLLFERHFANHPLTSTECELVFDNAIAEAEEFNLKAYLRGNGRLPRFDKILQCDSRYVPMLQFIDVIIHCVKEYYFGDPRSIDNRLLSHVDIYDVSCPSKEGRQFVDI